MNEKLGRNAPCWCGSLKKYKQCHLGRDKREPFSIEDAHTASKKLTAQKKCSVSDKEKIKCSNKIVRAHTLSKSSCLGDIAENGHVMGIKHGIGKTGQKKRGLSFDKIGVNKASTFTGYCSYHDKVLFSPLEDRAFSLELVQLSLLALRPIARELYAKESSVEFTKTIREFDKGKGSFIQRYIQEYADSFLIGANLAVKDLKYLKITIEECIFSNQFDLLSHFIIHLKNTPKVMACASVAPEFDFDGTRLQTIGYDLEMPAYLTFNCLSFKNKGYFIFTWLKKHDEVASLFIDAISKIPLKKLGGKLTAFLFAYSENIYSSVSWWDVLDSEKKDNLERLLMDGISNPVHDCNAISNDNLSYDAICVDKFYRI